MKLWELLVAIRTTSVLSAKEFYWIISEALDSGLVNEVQLADKIDADLPTIRRWKAGRNAPHPLARRPIYDYLIRRLRALKGREKARMTARRIARQQEIDREVERRVQNQVEEEL